MDKETKGSIVIDWLIPKSYRGPWITVHQTDAFKYQVRDDGRRRAVRRGAVTVLPNGWVLEGSSMKGKWFRRAYYSAQPISRDTMP